MGLQPAVAYFNKKEPAITEIKGGNDFISNKKKNISLTNNYEKMNYAKKNPHLKKIQMRIPFFTTFFVLPGLYN